MNIKARSWNSHALYAATIGMAISLSANASFVFSTSSTRSLPICGNDFNSDLADLNFDQMSTGSQLGVSEDGFVDYYYIGAESGFTNTFATGDYWVTEYNEGFNFDGYSGFTTAVSAGDVLDFRFTSMNSTALTPVDNFNGTNLQGLGIFFDSSRAGSLVQVLLGYDDQTINDDDDHEDLLMRADFRPATAVSKTIAASPVPVPASAYLLISGLLTLVSLTLKRKKLV